MVKPLTIQDIGTAVFVNDRACITWERYEAKLIGISEDGEFVKVKWLWRSYWVDAYKVKRFTSLE